MITEQAVTEALMDWYPRGTFFDQEERRLMRFVLERHEQRALCDGVVSAALSWTPVRVVVAATFDKRRSSVDFTAVCNDGTVWDVSYVDARGVLHWHQVGASGTTEHQMPTVPQPAQQKAQGGSGAVGETRCPQCGSTTLIQSNVLGYLCCTRCGKGSIPK